MKRHFTSTHSSCRIVEQRSQGERFPRHDHCRDGRVKSHKRVSSTVLTRPICSAARQRPFYWHVIGNYPSCFLTTWALPARIQLGFVLFVRQEFHLSHFCQSRKKYGIPQAESTWPQATRSTLFSSWSDWSQAKCGGSPHHTCPNRNSAGNRKE